MLRELVGDAGDNGFAIASMLFFITVFGGVVLRALTLTPEERGARARIPLEDDAATTSDDGGAHG